MPIQFYNQYSEAAFEGQILTNPNYGLNTIGQIQQAHAAVDLIPGRVAYRTASDASGITVSNTGTSAQMVGFVMPLNVSEKNVTEGRLASVNGSFTNLTSQTNYVIRANEPVSILRRGYMWIIGENAFPVTATTYAARTVQGTGNNNQAIGRLAAIAAAGANQVATPANMVITVVRPQTSTSGGLVLIHVDFVTNAGLV